ncbi:hypothetical protein [Streptomonospora wellingtoniae]|uniref:Zinc-finger domain-containing protein n=1 Tax=Streptomonospora wellingtoniae TaxID=3075544 RepID=A0ABU2KRS4_9ACTN|nr:hypothetical protein [Streptomonospora sp. DSM 45055]MDT0301986.1 hypothetical protein [Streptomonospora sp. DSM 45055]
MTSHVDAETLALSAEGLLEDDDESTVQQHVADCAACAAQRSELADVTRALAEVPAAPLPDSVAEQLEAAVRAETESRRAEGGGSGSGGSDGGSGDGSTAAGSGPPTPGLPPNVVPMRRRWINYLAVAAAAVVVVGGGTAVMRGFVSDPVDGRLAGPGDGASEHSAHKDAGLAYHPVVVESGTVYTEDRLTEQAGGVLRQSDPTTPDGAEGDAGGSAQEGRADSSEVPDDVSSCLQARANDSGRNPMLVDLAEYSSDGAPSPAWVMYYGSTPGSGEQDSYDVVVLSPDCGTGGGSAPVLAETAVPAP